MDARGVYVTGGSEGWGLQPGVMAAPDLNDSGTDTDEDGQLIQQVAQSRVVEPSPVKAPKAKPKKPAGAITLRELINAGLLIAGPDVLHVDYKGSTTRAALGEDGVIHWKDMSFDSPSAFSIFLKRLVNPGRKADDGWKTVKYNNRYLEHYKMELVMQRVKGGAASVPAPPPSFGSPVAKNFTEKPKKAPKPVSTNKKPRLDMPDTTQAIATLKAMTSSESGPGKPPRRIKIKMRGPSTPKTGEEDESLPCHMHDFAPQDGEITRPCASRSKDASELANEAEGADTKPAMTMEVVNGQDVGAPYEHAANQPEDAPNDRPKRQVKVPQRLAAPLGKHDGHSMIECETYRAEPGSGDPGAQPFKVAVAPAVDVMMDFHAHLDHNEIIGLLAGTWDAKTKTLSVMRAVPVKELNASADGSNVEMDPVDQAKVQEVIELCYFMEVVGWYHSHPNFQALPSIIDVSNQLSSQRFRENDTPYIAAIVSPYNKKATGLQSGMCWFHVNYDPSDSVDVEKDPVTQGILPYRLAIDRLVTADSSSQLIKLVNQLRTLAERYTSNNSRVDLDGAWHEGGTRRHKLLSSVCSWLPPIFNDAQRQQYGMMVSNALTLAATAKATRRPVKRPAPSRAQTKAPKKASMPQASAQEEQRQALQQLNGNEVGVPKEEPATGTQGLSADGSATEEEQEEDDAAQRSPGQHLTSAKVAVGEPSEGLHGSDTDNAGSPNPSYSGSETGDDTGSEGDDQAAIDVVSNGNLH